jgi:large subunit ribosomal protein L20
MTRVKRGIISNKHRKNVLSKVKGMRFGRSKKEAQAREALFHAGNHAFAHRRDKKGTERRLWNIRINAACRPLGTTYSKLINLLKLKHIDLDRKVLSYLAKDHPHVFAHVVETAKK